MYTYTYLPFEDLPIIHGCLKFCGVFQRRLSLLAPGGGGGARFSDPRLALGWLQLSPSLSGRNGRETGSTYLDGFEATRCV